MSRWLGEATLQWYPSKIHVILAVELVQVELGRPKAICKEGHRYIGVDQKKWRLRRHRFWCDRCLHVSLGAYSR
jgi:hypothetical protein